MGYIAFRTPDTEYKIENIEWIILAIILAIMFIPFAISIWKNPSNFPKIMVEFFRLVLDLMIFCLDILGIYMGTLVTISMRLLVAVSIAIGLTTLLLIGLKGLCWCLNLPWMDSTHIWINDRTLI